MLTLKDPSWSLKSPRRWQAEAFPVVRAHLACETEPAMVSAIMGSGKSIFLCELCACAELNNNDVIVVSTSTESLVESLYADLRARCHNARSVGLYYGRSKRLGQVMVTCVPSMGNLAAILHAAGKRVMLWIADEAHKSECDTVLACQGVLKPAHRLGLTATPYRAGSFDSIRLFTKLLYRYGVKEAQADGNVVVPWKIVNCTSESEDLDQACVEMIRGAEGPGLTNAADIKDAAAFAMMLCERGVPAKATHSLHAPAVRQRTMADLEAGRLRCVVHVNLLSEGANYPWLMWLTLRRQVESRVRFNQEIGRALRYHDCPIWQSLRKTHATFYDPHDLFGTFSLSYEEALGEPPERPELEIEVRQPEEMAERIANADPPVAMAYIESVIRTLAVACDSAKLLGARRPIKKADRLKPITRIQVAAIGSCLDGIDGLAPDPWMNLLREIAEHPESIRFGFATDLLAALVGIRGSRQWPPVDEHGRIAAVPGEDATSAPPQRIPTRTAENGQIEMNFTMLGVL